MSYFFIFKQRRKSIERSFAIAKVHTKAVSPHSPYFAHLSLIQVFIFPFHIFFCHVVLFLCRYSCSIKHPCRQRHKGHRGDWLHPSEPLLKVNFGCTDTLSLLFRLTFLSALLNLSSLLKNRMIHRVDSLYIGLSASFFANLTFIV